MTDLRLAGLLLGALACLAAPPARPKAAPKAPRSAKGAKTESPAVVLPAALAPGESVDPAGGRALPIPTPLERRQDAQLTALADGRLLLSGGGAKPSTELLEGGASAWKPGPALRQARQGHTALLLADGKVLLLGGTENPAPAEVLDPATGKSEDLPGDARFGQSAQAVRLTDGRILMVDGASAKTWIWELGKKPSSAGSLQRARHFACLTALPEGGALITGGIAGEKPVSRAARMARMPQSDRDDTKTPLPAERFGARWKSWSALKPNLAPRARHRATLLPGGEVLLWGGQGADAQKATGVLECLDPAKETVRTVGTLHGDWGTVPAVATLEGGALAVVADASPRARRVAEPAGLLQALGQAPDLVLTNAYQEPLVASAGGRLLVLGSALSGASVDRWDPKAGSVQPCATLRAGSEGLAVLADKRVVSLGPVVDLLDPRSGRLTPLGWREDLASVLKGAQGVQAPGKGFEALAVPEGALAVVLDKTRALVAGPGQGLQLWEGPKKGLRPAGQLSSPRKLKGGLKLPDGSVLLWGREG